MTDDALLSRPLVPVASGEDAMATCDALFPRLPQGAVPVFVHVIEKAGGAMDKASVEQRDLVAEEMFDEVADRAAVADVDVETEVRYGTHVAGAIIDTAGDVDATAIVFTPRGGSRLWDIIGGGIRDDLVTDSHLPVVVLPQVDDA